MDRSRGGGAEAELRPEALALFAAGRLTPGTLAQRARGRVEVLYDLMEMPYGDDDLKAVDAVRAAAMQAAKLILAAGSEPPPPPGDVPQG